MNLDNKQKIAINAEDNNIVLLSSAGSGKSCPDSTPLPTPNGWTTVGEVKVGDYLFDRRGNPTKVLGVYPQGEREVYEITFRDKRKARCSIDHIWSVHKSTWKDKNDFRDYTLKQILEDEWVIEDERGYKSYLFSIPCSKAVKYENNKKLKVNPYLFGVFLGEGCCQEQDLTLFSSKEELIIRVQKILNSPQLYKEQLSCEWTFYKDLNNNRFKTQEILGEYKESICCRSYEKSIPDDFKYSSIEDRYELIRGLMDTKGIITRARGEYHVRFSTMSPKLRDDFIEVMGSLGYVCSYKTNKRSDKYTLGEAYEIIINIPNAEKHKLFSLSEKKEIALECKDRKQNQNFDRTTIINIKKLDYKEEMTCFYVDNDEHLFLINNFLCTHNTTVLTERVKFLRNKGVPAKDIVCISFSNLAAEEIRSRLDDEVCKEMFIGTIHSYANYILKTNGIDLSIDINMGKFDKILEKALTLPRRKFIKVKHLLIDEFQDTGDKEWEFIQHIPYENIYVLGDERQCQPAGTKVLTIENEEKNIEDIKIGDTIVGYSFDDGIFHNPLEKKSQGAKVLDIAHREYNDYLYTVKTENNNISSYTNNHITYVQIKELEKPLYCLFLICNERGRYYIGKTTLYDKDKKGKAYNGLRQKMLAEKCSKGWVLKVSFDEKEILKDEVLYSLEFGIPQLIFNIKRARAYISEQGENYTEIIDILYEEFNIEENAKKCLDFFGKNINYPYTKINDRKYFKQNSLTTIYACNLIPEIMYLAEFDQITLKKKIVSFELKKEKVNTTVYSLETESHNYVADGILTHNCIYRFNGCSDQYLKDCYYNPNFTTYYLNTNYRCSPNFVSFADEIVASLDKISPPTEVARKSNGIFEKTSFLNALEECQWQGNYRQWAILCRTNAEIESVSEILAEKKIPFVTFKNSELSFQEKQELLKKDAIKLLTIHTSKGSTFDHVIVVGAKLFNVEERCISYVAATRAKYTLFWCPQFKKKRNQPKTSLSTTKKMTQKTGVKMVQF